jgi:hypothetical protein
MMMMRLSVFALGNLFRAPLNSMLQSKLCLFYVVAFETRKKANDEQTGKGERDSESSV